MRRADSHAIGNDRCGRSISRPLDRHAGRSAGRSIGTPLDQQAARSARRSISNALDQSRPLDQDHTPQEETRSADSLPW
jgi:hypothetical protein